MIFIKPLLKLFILGLFIQLSSCASINNRNELSQEFIIKRGVNISHWLSQSDKNEEARLLYFSENDMEQIASLGYDHIRLPIDEKNMWDKNGVKDSLAFKSLHKAIVWAKKNNLKVIVDLHIVRSHYFNNNYNPLWDDISEKKKFVNLWKQLSSELKKYPNYLVAYEILNEPVANNPKDWNELISLTLKAIRLNEPNRKVVVGSNKWQSIDTFKDLKIPDNDSNIILSFHFYSPHVFTHYKAPWSKKVGFYTGPVKYPGVTIDKKDLVNYNTEQIESLSVDNTFYNKALINKKLQESIKIATKLKLQLYCGEFGSLPTTPNKDRMQWYDDVTSVFEENNIAWANWDYQGSFGIKDSKTGIINKELIKALLKGASN